MDPDDETDELPRPRSAAPTSEVLAAPAMTVGAPLAVPWARLVIVITPSIAVIMLCAVWTLHFLFGGQPALARAAPETRLTVQLAPAAPAIPPATSDMPPATPDMPPATPDVEPPPAGEAPPTPPAPPPPAAPPAKPREPWGIWQTPEGLLNLAGQDGEGHVYGLLTTGVQAEAVCGLWDPKSRALTLWIAEPCPAETPAALTLRVRNDTLQSSDSNRGFSATRAD